MTNQYSAIKLVSLKKNQEINTLTPLLSEGLLRREGCVIIQIAFIS